MDNLNQQPELPKDSKKTELKDKFAQIYSISNLFERQRHLIELSRQQKTYEPEEYCRLFEAYCQQRIRWMLVKRATQLFGIVSSLTVFIGVVTFVMESAGREQQLRASGWQVVTSNENTIANAGRKEALEYLNSPSFRWKITQWFQKSPTGDDDRVILSGLKVPNAHLSLVKLKKAKLQGANFQGATLYRADFEEANLFSSNLAKADLMGANLAKAKLERANLGDADLTDANLKEACLIRSNLRGAHLNSSDANGSDPKKKINIARTDFTGAIYDSGTNIQGITTNEVITNPGMLDKPEQEQGMILIGEGRNLSRKDLREANLQGAILRNTKLNGANLQAADLGGADLHKADLDGANLFKVRNLTKEQVFSAKNWHKAYYGDALRKILEAEKGPILRNPKGFRFSGKRIQGCPQSNPS